jgi:hypothetical protein
MRLRFRPSSIAISGFGFVFLCSCSGSSGGGGQLLPEGGTEDDASSATDAEGVSSGGACTSDKQCAASGELCDQNRHLCVACIDSSGCGDGGTCENGKCVVVETCNNSLDCPSGHVCDKTRGRCVDCLADADCPPMNACVGNTCRSKCTSDKDCRDQMLLCDTTAGYCSECLRDSDCKGGACTMSKCIAYACMPGSVACVNGGAITCSAQGDSYGPVMECPADGPCMPGTGCGKPGGQDAAEPDTQNVPPDSGQMMQVDAGGDPTLAMYWRLDELSGSTASDSSGNGHTGTLLGLANWGTGKINGAASLNGTSAYIEAAGPVIDTSKPFTVAAWAMLSSAPATYKTVLSIAGVSASGFYVQYRQDIGRFAFAMQLADADTSSVFAAAPAPPVASVWYHLAGVFDGANLNFYLNGSLVASTPRSGPWRAVGNTLVGRAQYAGLPTDFWPGLIDEVRFYSRALSGLEISKLAAQ